MYRIAAIVVALQVLGSAPAATVRVVALGATARLPQGWVLVEDAGPRGCAFEVPGGGKLEVVMWQLSSPGGDARNAAWEHLILLSRSCGFRAQGESDFPLPWQGKAVRVLGRTTDGNGAWSGAFVAFVPSPGEACVIGCFMSGADRLVQAAGAVERFISVLEMPGPTAPILVATTPVVRMCYLGEAAVVASVAPAYHRVSRPGLPPHLALLRPQVAAHPTGGPGALANEPDAEAKNRLAKVDQPGKVPAPITLSGLQARAATRPQIASKNLTLATAPGVLAPLGGAYRASNPSSRPSSVAVAPPETGGTVPSASSLPAAVSEASAAVVSPSPVVGGSRPERTVLWETLAGLRTSPPVVQSVLAGADSRPAARLAGGTVCAGTMAWLPQPRGTRPEGQSVLLGPSLPEVCALAAEALPSGGTHELTGTAVLRPALGRPDRATASVGTPSAMAVHAGPGLAATAAAAGPATPAGPGSSRPEGVLSHPPTAPVAAAASSSPSIAAVPTDRTVAPAASLPSSVRDSVLTRPSRSAPTAGWIEDAETGSLRIPVPLGWAVTSRVSKGPSGLAIVVEGVHSDDAAARFSWVQPALPAYRELSQLLTALGYREWQKYSDPQAGLELIVANRRPAKRYLEDVVLPDAQRGLLGWQILDAQPSDLTGGLLPAGEGLVAHLVGSTAEGGREGWYAVATGELPNLPHHVWAGAWLAAQARPGDCDVLNALGYVIKGARAQGEQAQELEQLIQSAQAALQDLLRAGLASGS